MEVSIYIGVSPFTQKKFDFGRTDPGFVPHLSGLSQGDICCEKAVVRDCPCVVVGSVSCSFFSCLPVVQASMLLTDPVLRCGRDPPAAEALEEETAGTRDNASYEGLQAVSSSANHESHDTVETSASSVTTTNGLVPSGQACSQNALNADDKGIVVASSPVGISTAGVSSGHVGCLNYAVEANSRGGRRDRCHRPGSREIHCDADKIVIVLPQRYIQTRTASDRAPA